MTKVKVAVGIKTEVERKAVCNALNSGSGNGVAEKVEMCVLCNQNAVEDTENMNICPQCFNALK